MNEDWDVLVSFLPGNWRQLAQTNGALKGLRKDKSAETLLRILLLHLGCGYSLRETALRASKANLATLSDVALLKRLRKSKDWLHALCVALFEEQGVNVSQAGGLPVRVFDATTVKEPGKTGALWRIHYSVRLPSLTCDFFKLTATKGQGVGESLAQFPIAAGDYVLADRGYSTALGIHHGVSSGAQVTVRLNTGALPLQLPSGLPFDLLTALASLKRGGTLRSWPVVAVGEGVAVPGRLCAIRKTQEAIKIAHARLRKEAARKGKQVQARTLVFANYVMVFTTWPEATFTAPEVLEWYRIRWQVELVFKRFKSLAQLGHVPKHDPESAKAWLYGKLLVALLTEKLIYHAATVSPWGYDLAAVSTSQRVA